MPSRITYSEASCSNSPIDPKSPISRQTSFISRPHSSGGGRLMHSSASNLVGRLEKTAELNDDSDMEIEMIDIDTNSDPKQSDETENSKEHENVKQKKEAFKKFMIREWKRLPNQLRRKIQETKEYFTTYPRRIRSGTPSPIIDETTGKSLTPDKYPYEILRQGSTNHPEIVPYKVDFEALQALNQLDEPERSTRLQRLQEEVKTERQERQKEFPGFQRSSNQNPSGQTETPIQSGLEISEIYNSSRIETGISKDQQSNSKGNPRDELARRISTVSSSSKRLFD
ncbi:uncharacterized protein I206_102828 [Kwoniella pini CBS 10737]|uniref:Uncharacterized protein n=1 Tax=Kwoniella pini CBS 10737 TaxID=1296096 RepID=A0A1B9I6F9_9TREE|nr:uncharacterized protein I206_03182 [Kwoniella pini CBS 10737]OCF51116.1 hypothetical protein I206_03182 [Kwoniella pini CBS 10737]